MWQKSPHPAGLDVVTSSAPESDLGMGGRKCVRGRTALFQHPEPLAVTFQKLVLKLVFSSSLSIPFSSHVVSFFQVVIQRVRTDFCKML